MVHSTIPRNICSGIRDPDLILKCFNHFQDGVIGAAGQDFHGYIRHEICRKSGRLVLVLRAIHKCKISATKLNQDTSSTKQTLRSAIRPMGTRSRK